MALISEHADLEGSAIASPLAAAEATMFRTNDEKHLVEPFFNSVLAKLNFESQTDPQTGPLAIVTVNHIVPTLTPYLNALSKIGRIATVIPKGAQDEDRIDKRILQEIAGKYPLDTNTRENFQKPGFVVPWLTSLIKTGEKLIILDIGGYFAPCLEELSSDPVLNKLLIGIIEDTENGHQKYEKVVAKSAYRIISVARGKLKETEDFNVGKSIVAGAITILMQQCNGLLERMKTIGVLGFGKIGCSIAENVWDKYKKELLVHDTKPIRRTMASSKGFALASREEILAKSELIFCATGQQCLSSDDLPLLKDNVFIASCTSRDDEFNFGDLKQKAKFRKNRDITAYYLPGTNKQINLMCDGNAVNFILYGANGPFIYLVQSGIIAGIHQLLSNTSSPPLGQIGVLSPSLEEELAELWCRAFEDRITAVPALMNPTASISSVPPLEWGLPSPSQQVVARDTYYDQIAQKLSMRTKATDDVVKICCLTGPGGYGKTEIIRYFAYHYANYCSAGLSEILWFEAEDLDGLVNQYLNFGKARKIFDPDLEIGKNIDSDTVIEKVKRYLTEHTGWLMIYDNAGDYEKYKKCIPSRGGRVVATARENVWPNHIKVHLMKPLEARSMARKILGDEEYTDEDINLLVDELDKLPLAIAYAAAYILRENISISLFLKSYQQNKVARLADKTKPADSLHIPVYATWDAQFAMLAEKYPEANFLLNCLAYLQPTNIYRDDLKGLWMESKAVASDAEVKEPENAARSANVAIRKLLDLSMVTPYGDGSIAIHRVFQAVIGAKQVELNVRRKYLKPVLRTLVGPNCGRLILEGCGKDPGCIEEIMTCYQESLAIQEDHCIRLALGCCFMVRGDSTGAFFNFEKSIALKPLSSAYFEYGMGLYLHKRVGEAISVLEKVESLDDDRFSYFGGMEFNSVIPEMQTEIQKNDVIWVGTHIITYFLLAKIMVEQHKPIRALDYINKIKAVKNRTIPTFITEWVTNASIKCEGELREISKLPKLSLLESPLASKDLDAPPQVSEQALPLQVLCIPPSSQVMSS